MRDHDKTEPILAIMCQTCAYHNGASWCFLFNEKRDPTNLCDQYLTRKT